MNHWIENPAWWGFEVVEKSGISPVDFWDGNDFP
jgi:hypothetical protein